MPDGLQISSAGFHLSSNAVMTVGTNTACCCTPAMKCGQTYSAIWDCKTKTWTGPTAGAKVCKNVSEMDAWIYTGSDARYCYYTRYVSTTTVCTVDADCTAITTTAPSLPANPTFCCGDNDTYGCASGSPDGSCCRTITATFGGVGCGNGTYDLTWNSPAGTYWEYDRGPNAPLFNVINIQCQYGDPWNADCVSTSTCFTYWLAIFYAEAAPACDNDGRPGYFSEQAQLIAVNHAGACPPTGPWINLPNTPAYYWPNATLTTTAC